MTLRYVGRSIGHRSLGRRVVLGLAMTAAALMAQPAAAQFFWSPPDFSTPPLTDAEATTALGLPGATAAEVKAGLVWNLRAALNVAALQCQFEPTLLSISNYNAMIAHHDAELDAAQTTLLGYFQRTVGKGKPGQMASDQYGTRIYSGYSTVQAQRGFCQAAALVGRQAIFAQRGTLNDVARNGLGSIKKSLVLAGEQFYGDPGRGYSLTLPSFDPKCWKKGKMLPACQLAWNQKIGVQP
ncbi:hypothetical protein A0J57_23885 [Sphingobium sp. 22B]|uniref:hypothetical protein n=1 Tax=unclassified Sphingobium TaxID=2611147 RepID=UPI000783B13D|nr:MULTISPECIES: hypothetical protein [unclassified Sphingobium]KXU29390.1 hypothetical protein AXW74_23245 [Sphingobium sp. AM]KYC29804.1 hypothetical protein A0J57_23885 [Sphingobium sp. 22B]OAP29367.1 hypothetical protein A8O16_24015 [Sphingobium sp. 20006FA]